MAVLVQHEPAALRHGDVGRERVRREAHEPGAVGRVREVRFAPVSRVRVSVVGAIHKEPRHCHLGHDESGAPVDGAHVRPGVVIRVGPDRLGLVASQADGARVEERSLGADVERRIRALRGLDADVENEQMAQGQSARSTNEQPAARGCPRPDPRHCQPRKQHEVEHHEEVEILGGHGNRVVGRQQPQQAEHVHWASPRHHQRNAQHEHAQMPRV